MSDASQLAANVGVDWNCDQFVSPPGVSAAPGTAQVPATQLRMYTRMLASLRRLVEDRYSLLKDRPELFQ